MSNNIFNQFPKLKNKLSLYINDELKPPCNDIAFEKPFYVGPISKTQRGYIVSYLVTWPKGGMDFRFATLPTLAVAKQTKESLLRKCQ